MPLTRYALTGSAGFMILLLAWIAPWLARGTIRRTIYRCLAFLGGVSTLSSSSRARVEPVSTSAGSEI